MQGRYLHPGGSASRGLCIQGVSIHRGVCIQGVDIQGICIQWGWADPLSDTMGYGQPVGSTHPTGMHSCFF